jgi:hypothetical protein
MTPAGEPPRYCGLGTASAVTESEDIAEQYANRISGIPYDAKFI